MARKEYVFQSIMSYEAENEEDARTELQYDLKHNGNRLFDCVQESNVEGDLNE